MKRFIKILISSFVIAAVISMLPFKGACEDLYKDVFRLHIIPNSNSAMDQSLKINVRDQILASVSPLYKDVKTKAQAQDITRNNLKYIEKTAQDIVNKNGFDYPVSVAVKNIYFNTRYYDDFTMPAGMYDALEITIGEGKGSNWWCVMYPSLCVGAATKESMKEDLSKGEYSVVTSEDVEYKFKIVEYYEKLRSLFK